jgi:LuxR family maltose regulon positive regulatory protein
VTLAAPGGWIRPFVEPGPQVAELLRRLSPRAAVEKDFIRRVLGAFAKEATTLGAMADPAAAASAQAALGPDALTDREREILALLAERLQNKEIASKLFISTHTVNDHLKHIYQKLAVGNRRQAVERARELGILGRERRASL